MKPSIHLGPSKLAKTSGGSKKRLIMKAAEELFTSRRFHEITMDEVAAAAGVAKGTLYGYFRDKEDLFFQTCTSGLDELCAVIAAAAPSSKPFRTQLLGACRQISRFADRRHQLMRMLQAEEGRMTYCKGGLHDSWMAKRANLVEAVGQILHRGVQEGLIRNDVSVEVLANILMGMLRTRAHKLDKVPPNMRSYELIIDLFCRGAQNGSVAEAVGPKSVVNKRSTTCSRS